MNIKPHFFLIYTIIWYCDTVLLKKYPIFYAGPDVTLLSSFFVAFLSFSFFLALAVISAPSFLSLHSSNYSIILLSCYFSNFLQDCPYVTLLSAFLPCPFPFFLLLFSPHLSVWHRQLLLIAWVWSFVVFVPLILLLCKSFPLMICFFFFF